VRTRGERFPKLKPGPGQSAQDVAVHQRRRLQAAMVELVAEGGYGAVTVAALSDRACVSKRDFYKWFSGKEECFLSTYDLVIHRSLEGILAAVEGEEDPLERLRLGFHAFADQVAGNPEAARLALVEVFAVGGGAAPRLLRANRLFEALVARYVSPSERLPLPPLVVKGIVGGGARVTRTWLRAGAPRALDGEELMGWALSFRDSGVLRLRGLPVAGAPPALPAAVVGPAPGDERGLILAATAKLSAETGYAGLTVSRVRAAAGLSRRSFESHFEGVGDCFLATVSMLSGRTLAAAEPAFLSAGDWGCGIHRMVVALCHLLARDPAFARLAFLDLYSPGEGAIRWRGELITQLAATLRRRAEPEWQPGELAAEASVAAMWSVIHHLVAGGRVESLPAAAPVLSYLALAPALGAAAAIEVIVAESSRSPGAAAPAVRR
jgi:AcrR family transcriptional regulator